MTWIRLAMNGTTSADPFKFSHPVYPHSEHMEDDDEETMTVPPWVTLE